MTSGAVFGSGGGRAEEYSQWADRLKAKRARSQEAIRTAQGDGERSDGDGGGRADDWSAEALFADSRQVAEDELQVGATPEAIRDLLAVFNLTPSADMADVATAHRRLAKLHHPDRYADAPAAVRERHEQQMAAINSAYETLRQRMT